MSRIFLFEGVRAISESVAWIELGVTEKMTVGFIYALCAEQRSWFW